MNVDFLAGLLCGNILLPPLLYRLRRGGRWDGWLDGARLKPAVGQYVLVYMPGNPDGVIGCTYTGPDGDGEYPEDMRIYWRALPPPPILFGRRAP